MVIKMEILEKKLKTIEGGNVLDIGSGRGEFIHIIKEFKSFNKITANDIEQRSGDFIQEHFKDIIIDFVKADAGDLPVLSTGFETEEEIFEARYDAVLAEGFGTAAISNGDVYANLDDYYIINYWPNTEYLDPGHIEGAIQYTPSDDLPLDAYLKTLPTDKTVVVYCYTGQNSARVAAYLRIIGYDAKSLKFGANSMIWSEMTKSRWTPEAPMEYDYVGQTK